MSSKARVDASLRVIHTSGPPRPAPCWLPQADSPHIGLWTSLRRSSWGLHMFFLLPCQQKVRVPQHQPTLPHSHTRDTFFLLCRKCIFYIYVHIFPAYTVCAVNPLCLIAAKHPYNVFPLICCMHKYTHTHTHTHRRKHNTLCSFYLSVPSW